MANLTRRHSINMPGINYQGFFSPAVAYASAANIEAFSRSGTDGQIGVFNADNTLRTTALAAGNKFYIAQARSIDGEIQVRRSVELTFGGTDTEARKQVYDAPATQVDTIGYNGTDGDLAIDLVGGVQEFVFSARDTTPGNQPFPVEEARYVARSNNTTDYVIAKELVADFNNDFDFEENSDVGFAFAELRSDGATGAVVPTASVIRGTANVTASAAHGLSVGNFINIDSNLYRVQTVPTTTTLVLDRQWPGASATGLTIQTVTVTNNTTQFGIRITALNNDINFVTGVAEELSEARIENTTAWKLGSGADYQVAQLEENAQVYNGETTINTAFREDWGEATDYVVDGGQYDLFFLDYRKSVRSVGAPLTLETYLGHIIISAPTGAGTSPNDELDTVFGL